MTDTHFTDTDAPHAGITARSVFAGLRPSVTPTDARRERGRVAKGILTTVPIVLVGSMAAMTLNLTGPVEPADAKPLKPRGATSDFGKTLRGAMSAATSALKSTTAALTSSTPAPAMYRVQAGDTISDIAGRYGLSTASVLALNGLGWSSLIFPGQELKLTSNGTMPALAETPAEPTASGRYTIVTGDTISGIAARFGVSTLSVLTANGLGWSSIIYPGQTLAIPGLMGPGIPTVDPAPVDDFVETSARTPLEDAAPVVEQTVEPVAEPVIEAPPAEPTPAPAPTSNYTIVSGDTLSGIAAKFGISLDSLLAANGLDSSSLIFSGDTLAIPGGGVVAAESGGTVTVAEGDLATNASIIIQVGRELGVSDYGIVIALATAMQESSMRNLSWGDRDSVGLFQQRPSAGWGSVDQLTDPYYAARLFYGGPSNPNAGYTRGLLDISGWESMPLTQAAQRVQISAYPDAYAKWEDSAWSWLAELG